MGFLPHNSFNRFAPFEYHRFHQYATSIISQIQTSHKMNIITFLSESTPLRKSVICYYLEKCSWKESSVCMQHVKKPLMCSLAWQSAKPPSDQRKCSLDISLSRFNIWCFMVTARISGKGMGNMLFSSMITKFLSISFKVTVFLG